MIYEIFVFLNNLLFLKPVYGQSLERTFDDIIDNQGSSTGTGAFSDLMGRIYDFAFPLAIVCAMALLTLGAYKMITSAGDPERLKEAKEVITNAILGLLMIGLGIGVLYLLADILDVPTD